MKRTKIRLLLTISEFMYSSQVRNLCDLVSKLDRDVFDVEIGALAVGDEATCEIDALNVPYYKLRLQPTRPIRARDMLTMLKGPLVIATRRYDVVHSLLYQSIFSEAFFVRYLGRAKYIYTKSNLEWDNHPSQWRLKSQLADKIISISDATSTLLKEKGFADKTVKIHLGIDTDAFKSSTDARAEFRAAHGIPQDAFLFGCVAQFVEWKEHLTAVRAFETVADVHPTAWLLVCGPHHNDKYFHSCRDYMENSRHASRIRLIGTQSDMPRLYSALDVFVLPSRFETFGYVYVEAMSCTKPVIGCRAAGPLEIIEDGVTGWLCNMSDPVHLASLMSRYVESPELATDHGKLARDRAVALFSKDAMARRTQDLYLRLVGT